MNFLENKNILEKLTNLLSESNKGELINIENVLSEKDIDKIYNFVKTLKKGNKTPKIWIISDTHFNHPDIISRFEFRPENYQEQIIRKIRNNVKDGDILIHLGDVIFDRPSELSGILNSMGGCIKVLVRGNHDKNNVDFYLNKGFNFVCDEYKVKNYLGINLVFSHKPKRDGELEEGWVNIHGHLHTNSHHLSEYTKYPERYILYSCEKENNMPLLLNNVLKNYKKNTPKNVWEIKEKEEENKEEY